MYRKGSQGWIKHYDFVLFDLFALQFEMGEQVHFSIGSEKNIKLTTVEDIDIFKALLMAKRSDWLKG